MLWNIKLLLVRENLFSKMNNLEEYFNFSLKDKISFFDLELYTEMDKSIDSKQLYIFLKKVILSDKENIYNRKQAIDLLIRLVFYDEIKIRQVLSILIDEWTIVEDYILESYRIKRLTLFYQHEPKDIEEILKTCTGSLNFSISSESNYQLGLIELFNANSDLDKKNYLKKLSNAQGYFNSSIEKEENRTDAKLLFLICVCLESSLQGKENEFKLVFNEIKKLIWEQRIFTFDEELISIHVGIFRVLCSFRRISEQKPEWWLDYIKQFNVLCYNFYEMQNCTTRKELFYKTINTNLSKNLIERKVEPLFKVNYKATLCKIDLILQDNYLDEQEKNFLVYLKNLINEKDDDEVQMINFNYEHLKEMYPSTSYKEFEQLYNGIFVQRDLSAVYKFLNDMNKYSYDRLLNCIITSCIKLQGNKIYLQASEDERNTYISNLLEALGFKNKDQTRWGRSNAGVSSGEIDIQIIDNNGTPFSIIEALNLDSLNKSYLNLHLDKIFGYDTTGLKYNFILSYVIVKDFEAFWIKYIEHIKNHSFEYPISDFNTKVGDEFEYANIRIGLSTHIRSGKNVGLYHICVNLDK